MEPSDSEPSDIEDQDFPPKRRSRRGEGHVIASEAAIESDAWGCMRFILFLSLQLLICADLILLLFYNIFSDGPDRDGIKRALFATVMITAIAIGIYMLTVEGRSTAYRIWGCCTHRRTLRICSIGVKLLVILAIVVCVVVFLSFQVVPENSRAAMLRLVDGKSASEPDNAP